MSNSDVSLHHLLVIDDNEAIHADFAKIFSRKSCDDDLMALDAELFGEEATLEYNFYDYELTFASQGCDGYELLKQAVEQGKRFGAAFVDMRMPPGWDGVETIEHLWQVDPDLQVVICTAFSDHSWDTIAERLGQTDKLLILKKPFDEIEVVQLATSLCEKRRLLEQERKRVQNLTDTVNTQESELVSAHHSVEVMIESISSILISLDEHGSVVHWNPAAEATFGLKAEEAIGKPIASLPISWSGVDDTHQQLLNWSEDDSSAHELCFTDQLDKLHSLELRVCRLGHHTISGALLIVGTDVTQQRFNQALLDQSQRLESVGQLAAGVAHEINTPMQYIGDNIRYVAKTINHMTDLLNYLTVLVDAEVPDEELIQVRKALVENNDARKIQTQLLQIPEALADSIDGVEVVSDIVAAMKELSHPGSEEKDTVSINHILESTASVARNEWKYSATLEMDLQSDLTTIQGLPSELQQAFLNIIVNSAHAIGDRVDRGEIEKGKITIKTEAFDDGVRVTIGDNGGGIPEHARHRIYEPFFTTKEVGRGTGQGLAIAHSVIVQKHAGKLWFDVEDGVGTTFTIEIPQSTNSDPVPTGAI